VAGADYVRGVSTGGSISSSRASACAFSKSEVSRICQALDEHVDAFRRRPQGAPTRICFWTPRSRTTATAAAWSPSRSSSRNGVHEAGRREILGIDVGEAETEAFWTDFLRSLVKRDLIDVGSRSQTPTPAHLECCCAERRTHARSRRGSHQGPIAEPVDVAAG
jgi:putative transposase